MSCRKRDMIVLVYQTPPIIFFSNRTDIFYSLIVGIKSHVLQAHILVVLMFNSREVNRTHKIQAVIIQVETLWKS